MRATRPIADPVLSMSVRLCKAAISTAAFLFVVVMLIRGYGWGFSGGAFVHWEWWTSLLALVLITVERPSWRQYQQRHRHCGST
jgi:hypothetical protein